MMYMVVVCCGTLMYFDREILSLRPAGGVFSCYAISAVVSASGRPAFRGPPMCPGCTALAPPLDPSTLRDVPSLESKIEVRSTDRPENEECLG